MFTPANVRSDGQPNAARACCCGVRPLRYQLSGCAGHAMDNELELVLENLAVLHDQVEISGRICHQIQVFERISVDQDQVA